MIEGLRDERKTTAFVRSAVEIENDDLDQDQSLPQVA